MRYAAHDPNQRSRAQVPNYADGFGQFNWRHERGQRAFDRRLASRWSCHFEYQHRGHWRAQRDVWFHRATLEANDDDGIVGGCLQSTAHEDRNGWLVHQSRIWIELPG